jgi:hypothetical protein
VTEEEAVHVAQVLLEQIVEERERAWWEEYERAGIEGRVNEVLEPAGWKLRLEIQLVLTTWSSSWQEMEGKMRYYSHEVRPCP